MKKIENLAVIAGNGGLPLLVASAARANNIRVIILAVNSETDKSIEKAAAKTYWVNLGEGKRLIEILKAESIKYAVMAGKITKATLFKESLRLDEEAKNIVKKVIDRKDDTLLGAVARRLGDFGIELIDSTLFLKEFMPSKGLFTAAKPDQGEYDDIRFGYDIAKELGRLDIGQAVAVKDKAVIALEAIEGTDEMIKRAGKIIPGCVIVKVAKPQQDARFDVPVIGPATIKALEEANAAVLAIEADKVIVIDKDRVISEADKARIAVIAV